MADLPPYMGSATTRGATTTKAVVTKTSNAPKGSKAFNAAFRAARKAGKAEFSFGGSRFNTKLAPTTTTTKSVNVRAAPTSTLKILDRQGQLQQAKTRDGRNATSGPEGLAAARTYFDRDKTKAGSVSGRFRQTMPNTHAALKELASPAGIAGALGTAAMAIPAGRALMGARAVGHAAHGVRAAFAAAPKAAATVAVKTAAPKVADKTAAKTAVKTAVKTAAPKVAVKTAAPKVAVKTAAKTAVKTAAPKVAKTVANKTLLPTPALSTRAKLLGGTAPRAMVGKTTNKVVLPTRGSPVTSTRTKLLSGTAQPKPVSTAVRQFGTPVVDITKHGARGATSTVRVGGVAHVPRAEMKAAQKVAAAADRAALAGASKSPAEVVAAAKARGMVPAKSVARANVIDALGTRASSNVPSVLARSAPRSSPRAATLGGTSVRAPGSPVAAARAHESAVATKARNAEQVASTMTKEMRDTATRAARSTAEKSRAEIARYKGPDAVPTAPKPEATRVRLSVKKG